MTKLSLLWLRNYLPFCHLPFWHNEVSGRSSSSRRGSEEPEQGVTQELEILFIRNVVRSVWNATPRKWMTRVICCRIWVWPRQRHTHTLPHTHSPTQPSLSLAVRHVRSAAPSPWNCTLSWLPATSFCRICLGRLNGSSSTSCNCNGPTTLPPFPLPSASPATRYFRAR